MKLEHRTVNHYLKVIFKTENILIVMQHKIGKIAKILLSVKTDHSSSKRLIWLWDEGNRDYSMESAYYWTSFIHE